MSYRELKSGEKIKIAFLFQIPSFWPSWESFYHACMDEARFFVNFYFINDGVYVSGQTENAANFLDEQRIPYTTFSWEHFDKFSPHAVVIQAPYDYSQRHPRMYARKFKENGIRVIYIPYGIELADTKSARNAHFREPVIKSAWRIYTMSSSFADEYKKYCQNFNAVRALGAPKFDALLNKTRFRLPVQVVKKANGRKIIVWHVHFPKKIDTDSGKRQVTPYLDEYVTFAQILNSFADLFFIFLPHPLFGDDCEVTSDKENILKALQVIEILTKTENVFIDKADDYRASLLNADAFISDRSALMIEAAVVGVPILYLRNPDYAEPMFPPLVKLVESYYQGTGCTEMVEFLDSFRKGEDTNKPDRDNALAECIPCIDGQSGRRIKDDIVNSMTASPEQVCNDGDLGISKRIVLFGTGYVNNKIMKYFKFPANYEVVAIVDNDSQKWGWAVNGVKVCSPKELNSFDFDKVIIMASGLNERQIYCQLMFELEVPPNKIEYCDYLSTL